MRVVIPNVFLKIIGANVRFAFVVLYFVRSFVRSCLLNVSGVVTCFSRKIANNLHKYSFLFYILYKYVLALFSILIFASTIVNSFRTILYYISIICTTYSFPDVYPCDTRLLLCISLYITLHFKASFIFSILTAPDLT